jgi:hypothetical protein
MDKYSLYKIREQFEQLPLREWLNKNKNMTISIVAACLLFSIIIIFASLGSDSVSPEKITQKAWFFDLNTNKLFINDDKKLPPIKAPSGPLPDGSKAGVKAYLYCRGYGENQSKPFIGFLETYTTSTKTDDKDQQKLSTIRMIRRKDDEEWFPADSYMGKMIMDELFRPNEKGQRLYHFAPK